MTWEKRLLSPRNHRPSITQLVWTFRMLTAVPRCHLMAEVIQNARCVWLIAKGQSCSTHKLSNYMQHIWLYNCQLVVYSECCIIITYDTKLFEQQQWQRKSQVSGHKKRDRAHLVHSPHLLLTGSVQGWSLLALLHGLLGKGSMQTWKKTKGQGRTTAARILQIQMTSTSLITGFWMIPDDSWWFLQLHLLLHILHGQERHKRCSASRDPHWPAAQLLRFPREWGPERKPGCGWLPVNSMCQSQILPFVCWSSGLKVKVSYNSELPMASPWCHLVIVVIGKPMQNLKYCLQWSARQCFDRHISVLSEAWSSSLDL